MAELTHFNEHGEAHMVDVGDKEKSKRRAVASGRIVMNQQAFDAIVAGTHKKGDVLGIARIAGIMAAKNTAQLIPLCHPIALTKIHIEFDADKESRAMVCRATSETRERTGVEMEALTAVNIALLTIYDMCKAVDKRMRIEAVHLQYKSGGKSGEFMHEGE